MTEGLNPRHLPYLDGLRAYSIVSVLLSHTLQWNPWLRGQPYLVALVADGLFGVRVFFVISGFLITLLLLRELEDRGEISLGGFYKRRIARIFPVFYLYVGVIACLAAAHIATVPAASFEAASTFTWNVAFLWRHGGSVDNSALFGHFWTLSIEEQFYLALPACLVFMGATVTRKLAVAGIVAIPLVRLAALFVLHDSALRQGIESRSGQDSILWGVLLAFCVRSGYLKKVSEVSFRSLWLGPLIGVVFVLCPFLTSLRGYGFESWLVPTLQCFAISVFLLWLLAARGGAIRAALDSWPARQLGVLSYSLYVWQQPFTEWVGLQALPHYLALVLPLAVAIGSYHLVEKPSREVLRGAFAQKNKMRKHEVVTTA